MLTTDAFEKLIIISWGLGGGDTKNALASQSLGLHTQLFLATRRLSGQFLRTSVSSLCSGGVGVWEGFREPHSSDLHLKLVFYNDRQAPRQVPLLCLVSLHSAGPWLVGFPLL